MKTKFLFAVVITGLLTTSVYAQSKTTFGIRGGVNFQTLSRKDADGEDVDYKMKPGFNAGVNAEIPVGIDFYLQPGLLFSTKGAKEKDSDRKINLSYLEIPVNFIYKPALGEGRMLLGFGPYAAFAVGGETKNPDIEIPFGDQPDEWKRFDAGANLLAGYEFSNRFSFQLNAGLGLIRLNNRPSDDNESSIKNTGFGVSLGYRFQ
jgi:hypothetical protein